MARTTTPKAIKYKRNFLDRVVIRFDFDNIELGKLKNFSERIQDKFPYQEQKDGRSGAMKIDLKRGQIVDNKLQPTTIWEFLGPSKQKKITVTSTYIAVEYLSRSYSDRNELLKDCDDIVLPFLEQFSVSTINRLGLRYVNNFDLNSIKKDFDWKDYFKPELLSGIQFAKKRKTKMMRSLNQLELKYEREDLRFVFGVFNPDYPNENTRREFVMDIDCYSRFPLEPKNDVHEAIERYNVHVQEIFENSITDSLRDILQKKV
jgi:uncharacterized protein (TIGR04255 family)